MGGSSKPKRASNSERNAAILAGRKSNIDAAALQDTAMRLRNSRRKGSLFGGAETGLGVAAI